MSVRQFEEERQQREQKLKEENKRLREALEFYANNGGHIARKALEGDKQ